MLIGQRVILWFLGLILVPVLAVSGLFYFGFKNNIQDNARKNLEYTADIQQDRIEEITARYQRTLIAFTTRLSLPESVGRFNDTQSEEDRDTLIRSLQASTKANEQYKNISILNLNGRVIASSNLDYIGRDVSNADAFKLYKDKNSTINNLSLNDGELELIMSGPIMLEDRPVGVVVIENKADILQEVVSDYKKLGETGETILARELSNGDVQYITNLRFDQNASLKRVVDGSNQNDPIARAVSGESATSMELVSYGGKEILSVSRPIEGTNWGIVVKIDQSEAFASLNDVIALSISIIFVVLVIGVFVAQYASRILTDPLIILSIAVEAMSRGDLSARVDLEKNKISSKGEYGILAKSFNNMAENLENLDKLKNEFVMLTSHQLRTPASSVKGYLSMLIDGFAKPGSDEWNELLASAYKENEQQLQLVNQILAVTQAETHNMKPSLEKVDLEVLIKNVVKQIRPVLIERDQHVVLNAPKKSRTIDGDKEKLYMIVENLIANASKYSPNGTTLTIEIKYNRQNATVAFIDQGFGIDPKDIDKLFNKFSRLNNPNSDISQSSGLGLYLVKKLVELHNGKISVASEGVGRGSTFTVVLPIKNKG